MKISDEVALYILIGIGGFIGFVGLIIGWEFLKEKLFPSAWKTPQPLVKRGAMKYMIIMMAIPAIIGILHDKKEVDKDLPFILFMAIVFGLGTIISCLDDIMEILLTEHRRLQAKTREEHVD